MFGRSLILGQVFACAALIGCSGGDKDTDSYDTDDAGTGGTGDACAEIVEFHPADGASDVYYRTTIEFTVSPAASTDTITVSQGGTNVAGTMSHDGDRVIFTPDAPLTPGTTYDVTLDWCAGPTSTSWTTSSVGAPVGDPESLEGNAYTLDLAGGRFVQPPGVGPLIQQQLTTDILIGVADITGSDITLNGALADDSGGQDMCSPSIVFPVAADFSENPYFEIEADTLALDIEGIAISIDDLTISGAFAADGSSIQGAVLAGFIDTRVLLDLVGGTEDGDVCELVAAFGVTCEPCSNGEPFCLSVFVDSMVANLAAGVTIVELTQEDIDANPDCAGGT